MKKQKQKQMQLDRTTIIDICKHKVQIWQQAEDRAKQYLMQARKRRKQAERELRKVTE